MKKLLFLFVLAIAIANAQQGNCSGSCDPNTPGVSCYLDIHDVYPDPDCNAPNCPGLKVFDLYHCTWYGWPCGDLNCIYCSGCASGNCPPGEHKALDNILSAFVPDSLKTLHEKAWGNGLHGFRGNKIIACRTRKITVYSWRKV